MVPRIALACALLAAVWPARAEASCVWILGDRICDDDGVQISQSDGDLGDCPGCAGVSIVASTTSLLYDVAAVASVALSGDPALLPDWFHAFGVTSGALALGTGATHMAMNPDADAALRFTPFLLGAVAGVPALVFGTWGLLTDAPPPPTGAALVCGATGCRAGVPSIHPLPVYADEARIEIGLIDATL